MNNINVLKELEQQIAARIDFKFRTIMEIFQETTDIIETTYTISFILKEPFDSITGYLILNKLNELAKEFTQYEFKFVVNSGNTSYPNAIASVNVKKKN